MTAHSVTHGAASARAAHAPASGGAGDAASDLAGGDDFAALLSQVAPEAVDGTKGAHIHGKGKPSSSQESDSDPSDALDTTDKKSNAVTAKAQIAVLVGKKSVTDESAVTDADAVAPQDTDTRKTGKNEKSDDHKSVRHKKAATDSANAVTLAVIPAPTPVSVPAANLSTAIAAAAADSDGEENAPSPAVASPQAVAPTAATSAATRPGKAAKTERPSTPSQANSMAQNSADALEDGKTPPAPLDDPILAEINNAHAAPQAKTASAHGTNNSNTAHNAANPASPSNPATPAAPATTTQPVAAAQPQVRTVQQLVVPQVAGVTATSMPHASAASQPATLSLHTAAPSTDQLPNLNSFALDIAAKSHDGLKQFDIRMDPPELGRVDVHLSIDDSGKVQAHLTADQPQTLALLQKDSSVLRGALRDAGLNMAQNGLNFSLKGQNPQQHSANNGASGRGRSLSLRATAAIDAAQSVIPVFSSTGADTRLDIHV